MHRVLTCVIVLLNLWVVGWGTQVKVSVSNPTKEHEQVLQRLQQQMDELKADMKFVCGHMTCSVEHVELLLHNKHPRMAQLLRRDNELAAVTGLESFMTRMIGAMRETSEELRSHMRGHSQIFFMKFFGSVQKRLFQSDTLGGEQCKKEGVNKGAGGEDADMYPVTLDRNKENNEEAVSSEIVREDGPLTEEKVAQILEDALTVQLIGTCENPEKNKNKNKQSFNFSVHFNNCSFSASTQMNEVFSKDSKELKPQANMMPMHLMDQLKQIQRILQPLMTEDRLMGPLFGRISLLLEAEPGEGEGEGESRKGVTDTSGEGGSAESGEEQEETEEGDPTIALNEMYPLEEETALVNLSNMFEETLREVGSIMKKKQEGEGSTQEQNTGDIKITTPLDPKSKEFKNLVGQIVGNITNDTEEGSELAEEVKKQVERVISENLGNIELVEKALKNELGQELSDVLNLSVLKNWDMKLKELEEEERKKQKESKNPIASYDITLE